MRRIGEVIDAGGLRYSHDDEHGVGCWSWGSTYAIACLPDSQYRSSAP